MLPSPNLDDRRFEQIVRDARSAIPKWLPDWTDENAHDPGITLVELFAWLSEMQQYYINRIPERSLLRFLKLLGEKPGLAREARTEVSVGGAARVMPLPAGTKLAAQDQRFETTQPISLHPAKLERVIVRTERDANDYTSTNENGGVSFYAFGPDARAGSRMYVAFDRELAAGTVMSVYFELHEPGAVPFTPPADARRDVIPSAAVSWKYYGISSDTGAGGTAEPGEAALAGGSGWMPLEIVEDETLHLMYGGTLTFRVPGPMRPVMVHPANDRGRYWICGMVEEAGYENPPRIEHIALNTVPAVQRDTFSELFHADGSGEPVQKVTVSSFLAAFGHIRVQTRENGGWLEWREFAGQRPASGRENGPLAGGARLYRCEQQIDSGEAHIVFSGGDGRAVPPQGASTIRIVASAPEFEAMRLLGRTDGLPAQRLTAYDCPLQNGRFMLQIGSKRRGGEWLWEDWTEVDDFDGSGPDDNHFVYDETSREIRFGDNERGRVPAASEEPNVIVIVCSIGGGTRGNVKHGMIDRFIHPYYEEAGLTVTNHAFAGGGKERESLQDCIERVQTRLSEPFRAVTGEDVERLVLRTPGLRVARVKALPLYLKGLRDYPRSQAPGQLTVAVVPYSPAAAPVPSKGFLQTVRRHLDERRLITTEVHVIAPEYIRITVHAVAIVEPHFVDEGRQMTAALNRLLQPLDGNDGSKGWPFGRTVYKGDLYGILNEMKGVAFIQELWLDAEGQHYSRTPSGDIEIPPYGLVYSGEHEVELISRTDI
ncbi:putative baseplate assembly protein [Paenibacillus humicola]|uniref:putative baseplate assembly protein n=1 Tax=Paenibacillus humicola TaxID=3110540 RepID=UPI00237B701E|nr:putative baseplate assembly protein [Paenibacillus humicola]